MSLRWNMVFLFINKNNARRMRRVSCGLAALLQTSRNFFSRYTKKLCHAVFIGRDVHRARRKCSPMSDTPAAGKG